MSNEKTNERKVIEDILDYINGVINSDDECYKSKIGMWYVTAFKDVKEMLQFSARLRGVDGI